MVSCEYTIVLQITNLTIQTIQLTHRTILSIKNQVVVSFPFIGGSFASFVVSEKSSKSKHLQFVAGVEPLTYWISTFLWDTINYQIPLWIVVALMFIFDIDILTTDSRNVFSGILAILFLFGPALAGFTYCASFAFTSASMCTVCVVSSGFFFGMGGRYTFVNDLFLMVLSALLTLAIFI